MTLKQGTNVGNEYKTKLSDQCNQLARLHYIQSNAKIKERVL